MHLRRRRLAAVTLLALTVLAAGCGSGSTSEKSADSRPAATRSDAPATTMDVTAGEYSFTLGTEGPYAAGYVPIRVRNTGKAPHQVMVARLHDGVTVSQFLEATAKDEFAGAQLVDAAGGVNAIAPGGTAEGYAELAPGHYVLLCYLPALEGGTHMAHGMVHPFDVVDGGTPVAAPSAIADVNLSEFKFGLPASGMGAPGVYRFVNTGRQPHEIAIMRLDDGTSLADVIAYLQGGFKGTPPVTFAGGVGEVAPGHTGYARLALTPGRYVAMCFIGDPATHHRHVELGMMAQFQV